MASSVESILDLFWYWNNSHWLLKFFNIRIRFKLKKTRKHQAVVSKILHVKILYKHVIIIMLVIRILIIFILIFFFLCYNESSSAAAAAVIILVMILLFLPLSRTLRMETLQHLFLRGWISLPRSGFHEWRHWRHLLRMDPANLFVAFVDAIFN